MAVMGISYLAAFERTGWPFVLSTVGAEPSVTDKKKAVIVVRSRNLSRQFYSISPT
jgi:hypothetical protein